MHALQRDRCLEPLRAPLDDELSEIVGIDDGRYLHERLKGKPTQTSRAARKFYGRDFRVTPDVLIRLETEHLVEAAIARIQPGDVVADVGTDRRDRDHEALETRALAFSLTAPPPRRASPAHNSSQLASISLSDLVELFPDRSIDVLVSNPPTFHELTSVAPSARRGPR